MHAIRINDVCRMTGLSRSTIYQQIAAGLFPRPIHLAGGRAARWLRSEVEDYIRDRAAERDNPESEDARFYGPPPETD